MESLKKYPSKNKIHVSLDEMERGHRKKLKVLATLHAKHNKWLGFFLGFLLGPTVITGSMFIPILGLLLSLLLVGLSAFYIYLQRSLLLLACWSLGILSSTTGIGFMLANNFARSELFIYVLIALSTTLLMTQNLFLSGLIWNHFDRGAQELDAEDKHKTSN
jgi:hypothetical protein